MDAYNMNSEVKISMRTLLAIPVLLIAFSFPRLAYAADGDIAEAGNYLCAPRLQLRHPQRCLQQGPGGELVQRVRQGEFPRPLPIVSIDPLLYYLPFNYVRVNDGGANLYPTAGAAASQSGATDGVAGGLVYLSYTDEIDQGGKKVFYTPQGYVSGAQARKVQPPSSPGLRFSRTPDQTFGWIISGGTCSQKTPGGVADFNNHCFIRNSVVQIYQTQRVGDWDWYKIGPDEWVEQRYLSIVNPDPARPEGVDSNRWINVNLFEQTVEAYEDGELVFATIISSGRYGTWTQPGTFQVWAKLERDVMTGGIPGAESGYYYLQNVPWVLYFDRARALHGTFWHGQFGTPNSRGCVNLAPADARWIFEFAEEGSWVHVWDPSGSTPTDPSLYGAGGA
jgi:hypothetical protein